MFVSIATIMAERNSLGAIVGALVATLPVSAGPVYVFLALDHDAGFYFRERGGKPGIQRRNRDLSNDLRSYCTTTLAVAQRVRCIRCLARPPCLALSAFHWTASRASVLNLVVFASCFFIVRPFFFTYACQRRRRPGNDSAIRAGMVTVLVGVIAALSFKIGAEGSGVLAVFPVIYASIMLILHRRIGGPATPGAGERHFRPCRVWCSAADAAPNSGATRFWLLAALGVSVAWNAAIYGVRRHHRTLA